MQSSEFSVLPSERAALPPTRPSGAAVPFYRLPDELLMVVLSYGSDGESMRRAIRLIDRYCCYRLSHDEDCWKQICLRAGLGEAVKSFDMKLWEECKSSRLWPCRSAFEWLYWSERPRVVLACGIAWDRKDRSVMIGIGKRRIDPNDVGGRSIVAGEWIGEVVHGYAREVFEWAPAVPKANCRFIPVSFRGSFGHGMRHNGIVTYTQACYRDDDESKVTTHRIRGEFRPDKATHQLMPFGEVTLYWDGGARTTCIMARGTYVHCDETVVYPNGDEIRGRYVKESTAPARWMQLFANGAKEEEFQVGEVRHRVVIRPDGYYFSTSGSKGKIRSSVGAVYDGQLKGDKPHGTGRYVDVSSDAYAGGFVDGQPEGHFIIEYKCGDRYEGGVKGFKRVGAGVLTRVDGTTVEGIFENDKPVLGTIRFVDGRRYSGSISKVDVPQGQGVFTFPDGISINGEFDDGEPMRGIIRWPNGKIYTGEICDWKPAYEFEPTLLKKQKTERVEK